MGICAAFCATSPLFGQAVLTLSGGPSVPVGSTSDRYKSGYNVNVGLGVTPPLSSFGVRLEGMFTQLRGRETNAGARTLSVSANATFSPAGAPPPLSFFYLIAGAGIYRTRPIDSPVPETGWNDDLGFNVGGGLTLVESALEPFLEVRVHRLSSEGGPIKFMPLNIGLRF